MEFGQFRGEPDQIRKPDSPIGLEQSQLNQTFKPSLKKRKTKETFFVFKVSLPTFAAHYEGQDYTKSNGNVLEPWFQECYHGRFGQ